MPCHIGVFLFPSWERETQPRGNLNDITNVFRAVYGQTSLDTINHPIPLEWLCSFPSHRHWLCDSILRQSTRGCRYPLPLVAIASSRHMSPILSAQSPFDQIHQDPTDLSVRGVRSRQTINAVAIVAIAASFARGRNP